MKSKFIISKKKIIMFFFLKNLYICKVPSFKETTARSKDNCRTALYMGPVHDGTGRKKDREG